MNNNASIFMIILIALFEFIIAFYDIKEKSTYARLSTGKRIIFMKKPYYILTQHFAWIWLYISIIIFIVNGHNKSHVNFVNTIVVSLLIVRFLPLTSIFSEIIKNVSNSKVDQGNNSVDNIGSI